MLEKKNLIILQFCNVLKNKVFFFLYVVTLKFFVLYNQVKSLKQFLLLQIIKATAHQVSNDNTSLIFRCPEFHLHNPVSMHN
jgi:hypothetical protein